MDRNKLLELKEVLDDILPTGEAPTDEDLDFDEDAIEMYSAIANLIAAMENYGF